MREMKDSGVAWIGEIPKDWEVGKVKQHYKITGLILFAIFLNPGYYIWRAHILHRKKTVPVIYTVLYSLLVLGSMVYTFMETFQMIMGMFYYY